jgi:hypothetical protein
MSRAVRWRVIWRDMLCTCVCAGFCRVLTEVFTEKNWSFCEQGFEGFFVGF